MSRGSLSHHHGDAGSPSNHLSPWQRGRVSGTAGECGVCHERGLHCLSQVEVQSSLRPTPAGYVRVGCGQLGTSEWGVVSWVRQSGVWPAGYVRVGCGQLGTSEWGVVGKIMLLSLHPNIIVRVENVVSLFSSPSTSSQKVQKCGSHNFLS